MICLITSGGRGIRTPGPVTVNSFQDCRIRPLCHSSLAVANIKSFFCLLKLFLFIFLKTLNLFLCPDLYLCDKLYLMTESIKNLYWRYATKKFDPSKKLSAEKIQTLKDAFNL